MRKESEFLLFGEIFKRSEKNPIFLVKNWKIFTSFALFKNTPCDLRIEMVRIIASLRCVLGAYEMKCLHHYGTTHLLEANFNYFSLGRKCRFDCQSARRFSFETTHLHSFSSLQILWNYIEHV